MNKIFEHKIIPFIILGLILISILFCCFKRCIVTPWRERVNIMQIKPYAQPNLMFTTIQPGHIVRII